MLQLPASYNIEVSKDKVGGKPVIAGTGVPVALLIGALAQGGHVEGFAKDYKVDITLCYRVLGDITWWMNGFE